MLVSPQFFPQAGCPGDVYLNLSSALLAERNQAKNQGNLYKTFVFFVVFLRFFCVFYNPSWVNL